MKNDVEILKVLDSLNKELDLLQLRYYVIVIVFYKLFSQKISQLAENQLNEKNIKYEDCTDEVLISSLQEMITKKLGASIEPKYHFNNVVKKLNLNEDIANDIESAFNSIKKLGKIKIFSKIDFNSSSLGVDKEQVNKTLSKIISNISKIDFQFDNKYLDILGDTYNYIISISKNRYRRMMFGIYYTPKHISSLMAKLLSANKDRIDNLYDPRCETGSLLSGVNAQCEVSNFYGEESNESHLIIAQLNLILQGINLENIDLQIGDAILEPKYLDKKFDAIICNPPYGVRFDKELNNRLLEDERFKEYSSVTFRAVTEFAYIQHILYQLDDNGEAVVIYPQRILYRENAEKEIRKYLITKQNCIDAVIGLPPNLSYGLSTPLVVLVLKKDRKDKDNILFIDASSDFEKRKNQNYLNDAQIEKIVETYKKREAKDKYSYLAPIDEIANNDYNLKILKYIEIFEDEEDINIDRVLLKIDDIDKEMRKINREIRHIKRQLDRDL